MRSGTSAQIVRSDKNLFENDPVYDKSTRQKVVGFSLQFRPILVPGVFSPIKGLSPTFFIGDVGDKYRGKDVEGRL